MVAFGTPVKDKGEPQGPQFAKHPLKEAAIAIEYVGTLGDEHQQEQTGSKAQTRIFESEEVEGDEDSCQQAQPPESVGGGVEMVAEVVEPKSVVRPT